MSQNVVDLGRFIVLSSALTGTDVRVVLPRNSPLDIAEQYFRTLRENVPAETVQELFATFDVVNSAQGLQKAAEAVLGHPAAGPVARSIIKLWLLSTWYDPQDPSVAVKIISSQAYKEGLVWKIMQSHPIGFSMWTFGYWAEDPPPLPAFLEPGFDPRKA